MTRRSRVMVSPLSFTVVSVSCNRTTAFTSSAYVLAGCCAAARSQSGTPAPALAGSNTASRRNRIVLVGFLRIGTAPRENRLLLISGADFAEEIPDIRILFQLEENTIHLQETLRYQLLAVKHHQVLVCRETDRRALHLRYGLNTIAIRNFDIDLV